MGLYPISTIGLGMDSEYSLNLIPSPPQNNTTFISPSLLFVLRHPLNGLRECHILISSGVRATDRIPSVGLQNPRRPFRWLRGEHQTLLQSPICPATLLGYYCKVRLQDCLHRRREGRLKP